jgi:GT2 family glycosyltransferase
MTPASGMMTGRSARRLVAVVVNHGTPAETIAAVRSVERDGQAAGIVVVDNGSLDDSVDRIRRELPGARVIAAERNCGFAAGCNLGIDEALEAGATLVFLLNSDATVGAGVLKALSDALDRDDELGIVAPLLVSAGDDDRIESAGIRYSVRTGRMRHLAYARSRRRTARPALSRVDGVSGCAMLVRRAVFEEVGRFDERYFFGFEDLDFCLRARQAGFSAAILGSTVARHQGHATIGRGSPRRLYFGARNHLRLAGRFGPQIWPLRASRAVAVVAWTTLYAATRSGIGFRAGFDAVRRGVRDHLAGRYGPEEPDEGRYSTNR